MEREHSDQDRLLRAELIKNLEKSIMSAERCIDVNDYFDFLQSIPMPGCNAFCFVTLQGQPKLYQKTHHPKTPKRGPSLFVDIATASEEHKSEQSRSKYVRVMDDLEGAESSDLWDDDCVNGGSIDHPSEHVPNSPASFTDDQVFSSARSAEFTAR